MPSRSSSGTVMPNSSSSAITTSTSSRRSRLSASRSSAKRASGTTLSSGTDSTSTAHLRKRANSSWSTVMLLRSGQLKLVAHPEATIDGNDGARDVGGVGRGEEGDDAGDLFGRTEGAQGDLVGHPLPEVVRQYGGHVGVDRPGCDDV